MHTGKAKKISCSPEAAVAFCFVCVLVFICWLIWGWGFCYCLGFFVTIRVFHKSFWTLQEEPQLKSLQLSQHTQNLFSAGVFI